MKKIVLLCLFFSSAHCIENTILQGSSFFSPRSQSIDAARHTVGWHPYIHKYDAQSWYAVFSANPYVSRSFKSDRIAQAMFGTDQLTISGSSIENRGAQDILADYFGLSPVFQSTVCLDPKIVTFMTEFALYIGLDGLTKGLYLEFFAPAVWTKWSFDMDETIVNDGATTPFPSLYMDGSTVNPGAKSFKDSLQGNVTFGQMTNPLAFGRVCGSQSEGGLSDFLAILGYDIVNNENGFAGLNARLGAPTGSRPNGQFLFEPIVGSGKHWSFGVGFAGRGLVWEKDGQQELNVFVEADFNHYFKARQCRSFDLCANEFASRYILAKEFDTDGNYTGELLPVINITTLPCDVSIDLEFEFLFMFGYTYKGYVFDFGYNGWLRSKEKIDLLCGIEPNKYGLKGIQDTNSIIGQLTNDTESIATVFGNEISEQANVVDVDSPVFIETCDINLRSAASPFVLTHKLFTHFGYAWKKGEHDSIVPFVGGGLSVEFEGINTTNTEKPNHNTLSEWAFWIKGGVSFS